MYMTEEPPKQPPFVLMLRKVLMPAEIAATALSVAGLILSFIGNPIEIALVLGLSTLATVYFLSGYLPTDAAGPPDDRGFAGLLPIITSKVVGIGMAVCCIGVLFHSLGLTGNGQMLLIGTSSVALAVIINVFLVFGNPGRLPLVRGSLLRGIPVALISGYFLSQVL
jgi:hypothetical protein